MLRRNWKHWYKPNFWIWWWHRDDHTDVRRTLAVLAALALLAAGFGAAAWASPGEEKQVVRTLRFVEEVQVPGKTRVVTVKETKRLPGKTIRLPGQTVTVQRAAETVVVHDPGQTVTVPGPVRVKKSVVAKPVVTTRDRLVRVTSPGITVTSPAETILRTVTEPGRTERETRTETQTRTITIDRPVTVRETIGRPVTVRETIGRPVTVTDTRTITNTRTETVRETVTQPVTVTQQVTVTVPKEK
jgi:hypothetical protein